MVLHLQHGDGSRSTAIVAPADFPSLRLGDFFYGALVIAIEWSVTEHGPYAA